MPMRRALLLPLLLCAPLASCTAPHSSSPRGGPSVEVDHIIVGVSDLDAGIAQFEQLSGVRAAPGGAHPGEGTRNALLSLGDGVYLELYAPNPAEIIRSPAVAELRSLTRLKPIGWAVSTDNAAALRLRLESLGLPLSPPEPGSRVRPDGSRLQWVTFGFEGVDHPLAPFFIQWTQPQLHPSRTSPRGCRLVSIRLRDPAATELRPAVQSLKLKVPVETARKQQMVVRLACPRGTITLM